MCSMNDHYKTVLIRFPRSQCAPLFSGNLKQKFYRNNPCPVQALHIEMYNVILKDHEDDIYHFTRFVTSL